MTMPHPHRLEQAAMKHIWACTCGLETECEAKDMALGAVWECKQCHTVFGHVYPRGGGRAWIKIGYDDVVFHDLLGHRRAEDEDEDAAVSHS